jgi:hypothetical protein
MPRKKSFIRLVGCCGLAAVFGKIYPSCHGAVGEFFQSMTLSMSNIIGHFCIGY